jgi:hypothetical protein
VILSLDDVTSGLRRPLAVEIAISRSKNDYNYRMAPAGQEMCMEH